MPPPERHSLSLCSKAVLFRRIGFTDYGDYLVDEPVEIDARFVRSEHESIDPQGGPIAASTDLLCNVEMLIGSQVWEGTLEEWNAADAQAKKGVFTVTQIDKYRDVKGRNTYRRIELSRFRDEQ